jgi:hypothetical protein
VTGVHEAVWLGPPPRAFAVRLGVAEAHHPPVGDGRGKAREDLRIHGGARTGQRRHGLPEHAELRPQPAGQHLFNLGERPDRGLGDPGHRTRGHGAEAQGDGDGFVIVEEQRRQLGYGPKLIAPATPGEALMG